MSATYLEEVVKPHPRMTGAAHQALLTEAWEHHLRAAGRRSVDGVARLRRTPRLPPHAARSGARCGSRATRTRSRRSSCATGASSRARGTARCACGTWRAGSASARSTTTARRYTRSRCAAGASSRRAARRSRCGTPRRGRACARSTTTTTSSTSSSRSSPTRRPRAPRAASAEAAAAAARARARPARDRRRRRARGRRRRRVGARRRVGRRVGRGRRARVGGGLALAALGENAGGSRQLASGADDGTIRLWTIGTWECNFTVYHSGQGQACGILALARAGDHLVSGSDSAEIKVLPRRAARRALGDDAEARAPLLLSLSLSLFCSERCGTRRRGCASTSSPGTAARCGRSPS